MMKGLTTVSLAVFLLLTLTAFAGDGKPKKIGNLCLLCNGNFCCITSNLFGSFPNLC